MKSSEPNNDSSVVMTIQEFADYIRVHYTSARRLVLSGEVPAFKAGGVWRIRRAEVNRWIQRGEQEKP
ncbi:MAG: helix-turn-helix domain-containing protein [Candidatus Acidiferrales bacterium]